VAKIKTPAQLEKPLPLPTPRIKEAEVLLTFQALKLRVEGKSHEEIGKELRMPTKMAKALTSSALKELEKDVTETAEEARQIELLRLDELVATHWPHKALPRHADLILKTMERRARYLALDQQVDGAGDETAEALRNFLAGARAATGVKAEEPGE